MIKEMLKEKNILTFLQLVESYAYTLMNESKKFSNGERTAEQFQAGVDEIAGKLHNMVQEASGLR